MSPTNSSSRIAVVVLGMHRSGTSALTRVLGLLGAQLAAELLETDHPGGRSGNWEAPSVTRFDERILAAAGSSWKDPMSTPSAWFTTDDASASITEGARLVEEQYGDAPLFVIKDPRICRLMPVWTSILEEVRADARFAIIVRHPLEVAASLEARDDIPEPTALMLWLRYALDAELHTRSRRRAFITYERLLEDWRGGVGSLRDSLQLPLASEDPAAEAEIDRFLSPSLRHHRRGFEESPDASRVERWAASAYEALVEAAGGDEGMLAGTLDPIRSEAEAAEELFRPVLRTAEQQRAEAEARRRHDRDRRRAAQRLAWKARDRAAKVRDRARAAERRAEAVEGRLRALRRSRSWRLTAPLRRLAGARKRGEPKEGASADGD